MFQGMWAKSLKVLTCPLLGLHKSVQVSFFRPTVDGTKIPAYFSGPGMYQTQKDLVNNGINFQAQLVSGFLKHEQYDSGLPV